MKRLNIALFMDSYLPKLDGVAVVMHNYAMILSQNHNVTVFVPGKEKDNDPSWPYKVVRTKQINFSKKTYGLPRIKGKLKKAVKNTEMDIIHSHSPFVMGKYAAKVAKKKKIPLITTLHTQFKKDFLRVTKSRIITHFLMKGVLKTLNKSDLVLTMTEMNKDIAREYGYKGPIKLVGNCTDLKYPSDAETRKKCIDEKLGTKGKKVLLFLGRIVTVKNVLFICDVYSEILKQSDEFTMVFVGDGPDMPKLVSKIKKLGIEDKVILVGEERSREMLTSYLLRADMFMFPSEYEMDSLVQKEAAACRTPACYIENSVTTASITHLDNGYCFKNDVKEFAQGVIDAFKDTDLLNKIGRRAQETIGQNWESLVNSKVIDIYMEEISKFNEKLNKNITK